MNTQSIILHFRRLQAISRKEFIHLFRDKVVMAFLLYAFTLDIYTATSGITLQLTGAALAVQDEDRSGLSRNFIDHLREPYFAIKNQPLQHGVQKRPETTLLDTGQALAILDVPPDFERDILQGRESNIQVLIDASNIVQAQLANAYLSEITMKFAFDLLGKITDLREASMAYMPVVMPAMRVWYNPNQHDTWFMGTMELLNVVTMFSILLPATAFVREKEKGTIEQLLVSPLNPFHIMLPKIFSMAAVILACMTLSFLCVLEPAFQVPIKGNIFLFFSLSLLYIFVVAGFGLLAATIARNLMQVGLLTILILAPMLFLSGAWTPAEAMPAWMRWVMYLSPLHYFIDVAFGILLKGLTIKELLNPVAGMTVIGMLTFAISIFRFRRQFG